MAIFSCVSTQGSSGASSAVSRTPTAPFGVGLAVAALMLAGCNANQTPDPSSRTVSQVFAGHYVENNPYNPISYAQNNTGRGGH